MTMSIFKTILPAAALAFALPLAAEAAVLKTIDVNYGAQPTQGEKNPIGDDRLFGDFVRIQDTTPGDLNDLTSDPTDIFTKSFIEIFNFADVLPGNVITGLELSLTYNRVDTSLVPGQTPDNLGTMVPSEAWSARILGTDDSSVADDTFVALDPIGSPATLTMMFDIDPTSDLTTSTSGFAQSAAAGNLRLRFRELSELTDSFDLYSAQLIVNGTPAPPVPLPASGVLLLGALGGAAALRRRRKSA